MVAAVLARNADFCTVLTWLKFYFLQMALLVVIGITPRAPTTGTIVLPWLSKAKVHPLQGLSIFPFPPALSLFLLSTLLSLQVGTHEDFVVIEFYCGRSYQVYTVIYLMIGLYGRELS